jgi:hypothetical protein
MALGSDMDQSRLQRNVKVLWAMLLLAAIYSSLVHFWFATTGNDRLIGSIGVLLGLYICSQPAANAVDLLFFQRGAVRQLSRDWSGIGWLALNALVLLVGWLVIVIGATRLTGHPG